MRPAQDYSFHVTPSLVDCLTGVWRFDRDTGWRASCYTPPGHLLHWVISGSYELAINGREYRVDAGDLIYYARSEEVQWLENEVPVSYYSIGFDAHRYDPPALTDRVVRAAWELRSLFEAVFDRRFATDVKDQLTAQASLLQILAWIEDHVQTSQMSRADEAADLWRRIERELQRQRLFRPQLEDLCRIGKASRATVNRSCRAATGLSPGQRLRFLRMEEARGLLLFSDLDLSAIATALHYPRPHEFSREFSAFFGSPPKKFRTQARRS